VRGKTARKGKSLRRLAEGVKRENCVTYVCAGKKKRGQKKEAGARAGDQRGKGD